MNNPLFSIGITTYNRKELLKQTLASVLSQTFPDFEVIVGNDFTGSPVSAGSLGISDPRVRFINNASNLGEAANMNSLLFLSRGRYFTWQFDDDLYDHNFLKLAHEALEFYNFPECVFTAYKSIGSGFKGFTGDLTAANRRLYRGKEFLKLYLKGKIKTMGCTGLYRCDLLKKQGGVTKLASGPIALYSEYLLLLRSGMFENIAYLDAPLVFYRSHELSWGCSNAQAQEYKDAGLNLISESLVILANPLLKDDFEVNFVSLLKLCAGDFLRKLYLKDKCVKIRGLIRYFSLLGNKIEPLKGSNIYLKARSALAKTLFSAFWVFIKLNLKSILPGPLAAKIMAIRRRLNPADNGS
ncbi:MAG: glycosyltransferase family 2 protein [Candidatus Omnitrophota bacterium]